MFFYAQGDAQGGAPCACRLATAEELRRVFRQPRGSVGPVGPALEDGAVVVLERSLADAGVLECGGGAPGWQLRTEPGHLGQLATCVVASIAA